MDTVSLLPAGSMEKQFIPDEFIPRGKNEYYLRNRQQPKPADSFRTLQSDEIETLIKNRNTCDDWNNIRVCDDFNPSLIKNCEFYGMIRIGRLIPVILSHQDLKIGAGITGCRIISCDIGDDVALHQVHYLSHCIIGNRCIIFDIGEMHTTNCAGFGNGILKDGEEENKRVWLDLMNEGGDRSVVPFDGMLSADAYLWAKYRDEPVLQKKLLSITQHSFDSHRGYYGYVGDQSVIKHTGVIKDVKIGSHACIQGANLLTNLTINSTENEPATIGSDVELVDGIVGYGCTIAFGCKANKFIMGNNSRFTYGARVLNSFVGDNSTISCCEIQNNLIFPGHEQHHNNSFLIASLVMGQSNIAAGATIGSNHNSRSNDNEIQAGRGFWPGLCTSVKHSSRFASFCLLAKGDFTAELDIRLPFSLVNNNALKDRLEILPAFWWTYNMYALARNSWKYEARDKRLTKSQHIEFDFLAPDTTEEIMEACRLLELWTGRAFVKNTESKDSSKSEQSLIKKGRSLLMEQPEDVGLRTIYGEEIEKSKRKTVILKCAEAYAAYKNMLHYYAVKNLVFFMETSTQPSLLFMNKTLNGKRKSKWINIGGQLITEFELQQLLKKIKSQKLKTWSDIHNAYDYLWEAYPLQKQRHAYSVLLELLSTQSLTPSQWKGALDKAVSIQEYICDQVYRSRKKDFENPFKQTTFQNPAEMKAVCGTAENDSFVKQVRSETEEFGRRVNKIKKR
ncbi:MAG: DUF4954 family protein [Chitinivibrionales bacterium]|nr:DUF4954 family protein [Chitinivibrionales bacterium]